MPETKSIIGHNKKKSSKQRVSCMQQLRWQCFNTPYNSLVLGHQTFSGVYSFWRPKYAIVRILYYVSYDHFHCKHCNRHKPNFMSMQQNFSFNRDGKGSGSLRYKTIGMFSGKGLLKLKYNFDQISEPRKSVEL